MAAVDACSSLGGRGCLRGHAVPVDRARTVGFGGTIGRPTVFLRSLPACTASLERFVGMQAVDGDEVLGASDVPGLAAEQPVVVVTVLSLNLGC